MMQNTSRLVERTLTFIEVYCQYIYKEDKMQILIANKDKTEKQCLYMSGN